MKPQSHTQKLFDLLSDGKPHRTDEILLKCYGDDHLGCAAITSRISDIRREHPEVFIPAAKRDSHNKTLYWYILKKIKIEPPVRIVKIGRKFITENKFTSKGWENTKTVIENIQNRQMALF